MAAATPASSSDPVWPEVVEGGTGTHWYHTKDACFEAITANPKAARDRRRHRYLTRPRVAGPALRPLESFMHVERAQHRALRMELLRLQGRT